MMKIRTLLRTSPVRALVRTSLLLALAAALPALADDEWYGGGGGGYYGDSGGGGGGGDVCVLPPFVVNGNDPATFDWAGYFASAEFYFMMTDPVSDTTPQADNPNPGDPGPSGGTTSASEGSATPGWDSMSKTNISSATGQVGTIRDQMKNDATLKAALADIVQKTKDSYKAEPHKFLGLIPYTTKTGQEYGIAYWVDANGNRVGTISTPGTGKAYSDGEKGSCDVAVPPKPVDGVSIVLVHTHAWGSDLSGDATMGDFQIAKDKNTFVFAVPMGEDKVEVVTPGAATAFEGKSSDIGVSTGKPPGF